MRPITVKHAVFIGALASLALLYAAHAHAHFKLMIPLSWLNEDAQGGPQKGSPCGPGNSRPFIGDDVQPIPVSTAVNTYHAGETVTVKWQETVYHPGYFRISIAKTTAANATNDDFPDPPLTDTENCHYDESAVQTTPHGNVLADGLYMASDVTGTNRSLSQDVKLPDEPCEHCTLQVVQVMKDHPAASCFYFHCADLKIVAADTGGAGKGGGGTGSKNDSGGCAVARAGSQHAANFGWCLLACAWIYKRRRAR